MADVDSTARHSGVGRLHVRPIDLVEATRPGPQPACVADCGHNCGHNCGPKCGHNCGPQCGWAGVWQFAADGRFSCPESAANDALRLGGPLVVRIRRGKPFVPTAG